MNVTTKYGYAHRLGRSNVLQLLDKPVALFFVVFGCPMIV
jgi:hypothetical protein